MSWLYEGNTRRAKVESQYRESVLCKVVREGLSEERHLSWDMREAKQLAEQKTGGRKFLEGEQALKWAETWQVEELKGKQQAATWWNWQSAEEGGSGWR